MRVLVDTSVWVAFLRGTNVENRLSTMLVEDRVFGHPWIVGELACGNLRDRADVLALIDKLPMAKQASNDEVRGLIEMEHLHGRGLGWVDIHLLASARLSGSALWTLDKHLAGAASRLGVAQTH